MDAQRTRVNIREEASYVDMQHSALSKHRSLELSMLAILQHVQKGQGRMLRSVVII